jgi:soluble lytic murein transglycosylase
MKKFLLIIPFFILFTAGIFLNAYFPLKYKTDIEYISKENNVDKALVYAIIKVESGFREKVVSHKGAVGLMQVLPSTSDWILELYGYNPTDYDLYNGSDNIFIGTLYLNYLHERFDNDIEKVVAAYNGGSSRIKNEVWKEIDETRYYVKKVKTAYFIYKYKLRIIEGTK